MVAIFAQEPRLYTSGTACCLAGAQWRTWHSHGKANARAFFGRISLVCYRTSKTPKLTQAQGEALRHVDAGPSTKGAVGG